MPQAPQRRNINPSTWHPHQRACENSLFCYVMSSQQIRIDSHPFQVVASLSERHFPDKTCLGGRIGAVRSAPCLNVRSARVRCVRACLCTYTSQSPKSATCLYETMSCISGLSAPLLCPSARVCDQIWSEDILNR